MDYFTELMNEIEQKIKEHELIVEQNNNSIVTVQKNFAEKNEEKELLHEKLNDLKSQEEDLLHPWHALVKKCYNDFPNLCALFIIHLVFAGVILLVDGYAIMKAFLIGSFIILFAGDVSKILFCKDTNLKKIYQRIKTTENIIKCLENEQMKLRFKQKDLNNQNKILMTHISDLEDKKEQLMFKKNEAFSRLMNHPTMKEYIKKIEESHSKMDELRSMQASYEEQFLNQEYENQSIEQELGVHLDLKQERK